MTNGVKRSLIAGAAAATTIAGIATAPATADARPWGYGGWHGGSGGGWAYRGGFGYRGFLRSALRLGLRSRL